MTDVLDDFAKGLEGQDPAEVRQKLAKGVYGERKIPIVRQWLEEQERAAGAASEARREEREQRGLRLQSWGLIAAVVLGLVGLLAGLCGGE